MKIEFEEPKFKLNDRVWIVCAPNHSIYTTIIAFRGIFLEDDKKGIESFANEVEINNLIIDDYFDEFDHNHIPFKYITYDEEEVKRWMKVHTVFMTNGEWFKAIGKRLTFDELHKAAIEHTYDSEDNLEESELGSCCTSIADIRTLLIKCKERESLIGWEREALQEMLDDCCCDLPEEHDLLDKIFSQLDVKWKK